MAERIRIPARIPGPVGRLGTGGGNGVTEPIFHQQVWISESLDSFNEETKDIIQSNNICKIKRQAKDGTLPNQKVEWLRVVVEEVQRECDMHNGTMTVKDPTGEIKCIVHHEIMDRLNLHPGCVLILKQVSVPCFNRNSQKCNCYLNLIKGNIYRMYSGNCK